MQPAVPAAEIVPSVEESLPKEEVSVTLQQQPQIIDEVSTQPEKTKAEDLKPEPMEEKKETTETQKVQGSTEDGIFKIRPTEFKSKINVVGQIDLATLNQSTRPKKKSKEEKRKEREERINNVRNNAGK